MFFTRRPPALPARDYPLVLRPEWLIDGNPRRGRLNALAGRSGAKTARPNGMVDKARLRDARAVAAE